MAAETPSVQTAAVQFVDIDAQVKRLSEEIGPVRKTRTRLSDAVMSYLSSLPEGEQRMQLANGTVVELKEVKRKESITKEYVHSRLVHLMGSVEQANAAINDIWETRPTHVDQKVVIKRGVVAQAGAGRKRSRASQ
jgi:hypothetical protein